MFLAFIALVSGQLINILTRFSISVVPAIDFGMIATLFIDSVCYFVKTEAKDIELIFSVDYCESKG